MFIPPGLEEAYNIYGVTEATVYQSISRNLLLETVGGQLFFTPLNAKIELKVDQMNNDELLVGGPQCLSYHKHRSDSFFVEHGTRWFRTGDRASPETLCILGRLDRQVKLNGFQIELGEVEAIVESASASVSAGVCFLREGTRLCCLVERIPGSQLPWQDFSFALRHYCESRMPQFQVPQEFHEVVGNMPLTTSGKVDRVRLVREFIFVERPESVAGDGGQKEEDHLTTDTERSLGELWSQILETSSRITPHTHFFEAGGDSVGAILMVSRMMSEDNNGELMHRRLCGLIRKPRLRDYAAYFDWTCRKGPTTHMNESDAPTSTTHNSTESQTLLAAIACGDAGVVKMLLDAGVDAQGGLGRKDRGVTPLLHAAKLCVANRLIITTLLLDHNADVNATDAQLQSAIMYDARRVESDWDSCVAQLLCDRGAAVRARDDNQWPVLFHAVSARNLKAVNFWIIKNISLGFPAVVGDCASSRGCRSQARKSGDLTSREFTNSGDRWGHSALHYAVESLDFAVCARLLEGLHDHGGKEKLHFRTQRRAHRRRNDVDGWESPLHIAVRLKSSNMLEMLLREGSLCPNKNRDESGRTALHAVCVVQAASPDEGDDVLDKMALALLHYGADPNTLFQPELRSPLFLLDASKANGERLQRLLLAHGADPSVLDVDGRTAAEYAVWRILNPGMNMEPSAPDMPATTKDQVKGRFHVVVDIDPGHRKKAGGGREAKHDCFRCQQNGHAYADCRNPPKCRVCGGVHETKEHK